MNLKFWEWPHNRRLRHHLEFQEMHESFVKALTESLRHTQIATSSNVHVTHAQRPPAPRPMRIVITWVMADGVEYRTFIPLNGQAEWTESAPHYVTQYAERLSHIRYSLGYNDGSML